MGLIEAGGAPRVLYVLRLVEPRSESTGGASDRRSSERAVILVEGVSDRVALEAVASRLDRDLSLEGISVVAMDGATNIGRFLDRFGPHGLGIVRAGLYDVTEEPDIRRGLERAGLGSGLSAPTWNGSASSPASRTSRTS
jgi:hypothetical protein